MATGASNTHEIRQTIRRTQTKLAEPICVEELNVAASTSLFHQHFDALTEMNPVHSWNRPRLTETRLILLAKQAGAQSAAYRVEVSACVAANQERARMGGTNQSNTR
ncbi:MAG TPA: hypothetical protein VMF52_18845 [Steroidobacteraceae bacterium]|nr:hypothetical protein [Steroidobacteraceae bacterium]